MHASRISFVITLSLAISMTVACGGNGNSSSGGGNPPPPPPPPIVAVSVFPSSATVAAGSHQQFTATVTNSSSTSVNWEVNGVVGGNTITGTISASGLYIAPLAPPAAGQVTITAVSQADATKFASAIVTPVFSNATLNGPYAFESVVSYNGGFTYTGGVFIADGAGNILNGVEDYNDSIVGAATGVAFSGTYSVSSDGQGTAVVTSANGTSTFKFVLSSTSAGQMIEFDSAAVTSGFVFAQDSNALSNIMGTYVFGFQGQDSGVGPASSVGQVQFDGFGNTSGTEDLNDAGTFSAGIPVSGTYAVGAQGRGSATLTTTNGTSTFMFYIVNAKTIEFLSIDTAGLLVNGNAEAQDNVLFSNASLSSGVFLLDGFDTSTFNSFAGTGRFDTDGAGNFLNGILDENGGGAFFDGLPFFGTYAIASNGRGTASVTTSNGTSSFVFWIYSSGNAQFMESDSAAVLIGVVRSQSTQPFAASSLNGHFAFTLAGASGGSLFAGLGRVSANGTGGFSGIENYDLGGTPVSGVSISGSYSVNANGSGTVLVSGGTPLRLMMISPAEAVFISADGSQPLIGLVEQQCSDCH